MTTRKIVVSSIDNLFLDIYIVGYPRQGESILCVLREDASILFVSLVDTYKPDARENYVADILNGIGKPPIDVLVWSHPDEDHSVGISEVMETFDPNHEASVFVPENIANIVENKAKQEFKKLLSWYAPSGKGTKLRTRFNTVSLSYGEVRTLYNITIFEQDTNLSVHLYLSFFLPNSSRINQKALKWDSIKTNEFSIVHSLTFNGQQYLFCGDLTKNNIILLPERFYSDVKFIKIPHHGSSEPSSLAMKMMSNGVSEAISASTVYSVGGNDNPKDDTISLYRKISKSVFSTGKGTSFDFGCIKLSLDKKGDLVSSELKGNAVLL